MTTVTADLIEEFAVDLETTDGHAWRADEPEAHGGSDTGPDPYELLVGALAACTTMTISMYCKRNGWPLEGVTARFTHGRIHADDCARCEEDEHGHVDRVESEITIHGEFDDDQRERLRRAAEKCPVRKTLQKGMLVADDIGFSTTGADA